MKKILSIILSAISAMLGIFLVSCDSTREPQKSYAYYGIVQTLDGYDGLYVNVPDFGICQLPTYEECKTPNVTLKEGDLISLTFNAEIQVTKSYPAIISTPARYVSVYKKDIEFKTTNEKYLLTIDYTEEIKNELLGYNKKVGDFVYFWRYEGVPTNSGGVLSVQDYAMATIERITDDKLTLSLSLTQDMQDFFKYYASDDLTLKAQKVNGSEQAKFCNFFDVQDLLALTDIQRIVKAREVYIGNTTRCPSEYKTSSNEEDIENVYRFLKYTLINPLIREIAPSEITNGFGDAYEMTVYTSRGDFKIQQICWGYFKIWDKYYVMGGGGDRELPTLKCNKPYYKIDYSVENTVKFYNFENFSGEYEVKLSELELEKLTSNPDMQSLGFFLKTDAGVIELYSERYFYLKGIGYYAVIGEKDFSSIFDENSMLVKMISKNYQLIKLIYAQKIDPTHSDHECLINVYNYYGEYESGAIVAMVGCGYFYEVDLPLYEGTIDQIPPYPNGHPYPDTDSDFFELAGVTFPNFAQYVTVFYEGGCWSLFEAYEDGLLTQADIKSLAIRIGNNRDHVLDDYFSNVNN